MSFFKALKQARHEQKIENLSRKNQKLMAKRLKIKRRQQILNAKRESLLEKDK